jgi:hypothetical protein
VFASTRRGGCRRARTWEAAPDLAATTERARGEPPPGRGRGRAAGGRWRAAVVGHRRRWRTGRGGGGGRRREEGRGGGGGMREGDGRRRGVRGLALRLLGELRDLAAISRGRGAFCKIDRCERCSTRRP